MGRRKSREQVLGMLKGQRAAGGKVEGERAAGGKAEGERAAGLLPLRTCWQQVMLGGRCMKLCTSIHPSIPPHTHTSTLCCISLLTGAWAHGLTSVQKARPQCRREPAAPSLATRLPAALRPETKRAP
eukprot:308663-Chlamydomonas_euryale.AAC.2